MVHLSAWVMATAMTAGGPPPPGGAPPAAAHPPAHVRAASPRARDTLSVALARAAIVRALAARLDTLDAIVFVDARLDPALPTAETILVTTTPSVKYLRITFNPARPEDDRIELIGHELQHAVEIASAPAVVDGASFRRHFETIGRAALGTGRSEHAFETQAAKDVQLRIRRELAAHPSSRAAAGGHDQR